MASAKNHKGRFKLQTKKWIRDHVKGSRHYQLLSGHASIGSYLAEKVNVIQPSECWWCELRLSMIGQFNVKPAF